MSLPKYSGVIDKDTATAEYFSSPNLTPRFKNPLDLNTLLTTNSVSFEMDGSGQILEPDDEDETFYSDEDEEEMTGRGHLRKFSGTHSKTGKPFSFGCDMTFDMFYDPERLKDMENVEGTGGIVKTIVKEGGDSVLLNSKVYIHYSCFIDGMGEPYDTTVTRGAHIPVDLRACEGIPGILLAVKSMKVGEIAKFRIRYDLAFGVVGCPPRIPAATDILCIIQVLYFISEEQLKSVVYMTSEERGALEFTEILKAVKDLRAEANAEYKEGKFWRAIKRYRKGIYILEEYPLIGAEHASLREQMIFTFYSNLGQCYLKVERPQQVCVTCQYALRCAENQHDLNYAKVLYRFAEAKIMLGNYDHAKKLNKQALLRQPSNSSILDQKATIVKRINDGKAMSKNLLEKMGRSLLFSGNDRNSETVKECSSSSNTPKVLISGLELDSGQNSEQRTPETLQNGLLTEETFDVGVKSAAVDEEIKQIPAVKRPDVCQNENINDDSFLDWNEYQNEISEIDDNAESPNELPEWRTQFCNAGAGKPRATKLQLADDRQGVSLGDCRGPLVNRLPSLFDVAVSVPRKPQKPKK